MDSRGTSPAEQQRLKALCEQLHANALIGPFLRDAKGLGYNPRSRQTGFLDDDRHRVARSLDGFLDRLDELRAESADTSALDRLAEAILRDLDPRLLAWVTHRRERRQS